VALPVVSASGTVNAIVGADEIGSARAQWYLGAYYSVHVPADLPCVTMFRGGCCRTAVKEKGTVSMVGGWRGWEKEGLMTGKKDTG
jgi:hypothetical protein